MKKSMMTLSLVLVLILTVVLSGCANKNTDNTSSAPADSGNSESASKPVEISVFSVQESGIDVPTNKFSKFVEDKFNIKFKWEINPSDGAKEKRQISLASGDYPDAYLLTHYIDQFSQADLLKYGKQGVLIPLNDLIDKYAPNIKAAMEKNDNLRTLNTAPDGNIYGLVAYTECFHCSYPSKMWLNTEWLKKLNLEMPKTTEEFKKVLEAFKTQDPNGNGKADEVPLSGSIEEFGVRIVPFLMNAFVYDDDRNYLNMMDGKVQSAAVTPEWKEGLTYIKSLFDAGLIDPGHSHRMRKPLRKSVKMPMRKFWALVRACTLRFSSILIRAIEARHTTILYHRLADRKVSPMRLMMQVAYPQERNLSSPTKLARKHRSL